MARVDRRPLLHIAVRLELRHVLRAAEEHRHPVVQARRHLWGRAVGRGRGSARARQCPRGSARARRYEAVAVATVTDEAAAARARRTVAFGKGGGRWQGRGQGRGQGAPRPASSAHRPRRDRRTPVFTATRCEETPTPTPPPSGGHRRHLRDVRERRRLVQEAKVRPRVASPACGGDTHTRKCEHTAGRQQPRVAEATACALRSNSCPL